MAVYTDVAEDELRAFLGEYDIGEALACKGIAEGVENSNFLLTTERGNFILTLYEKRVAVDDLPFFIALMEHLARLGVACPTPVRGRDGVALRSLRSARRDRDLSPRDVAAADPALSLQRARPGACAFASRRRLVSVRARE
jgi:Ser/Thr protein kinase RdoA (MazF antagonist)